jgi:hypothetical protein
LSIKNNGHDYLGRSSLKESLGLWRHNLKSLSRNPAFIPDGCSSNVEAVDTITTGAGISSQEVYQFSQAQNVTFVGGYASTMVCQEVGSEAAATLSCFLFWGWGLIACFNQDRNSWWCLPRCEFLSKPGFVLGAERRRWWDVWSGDGSYRQSRVRYEFGCRVY